MVRIKAWTRPVFVACLLGEALARLGKNTALMTETLELWGDAPRSTRMIYEGHRAEEVDVAMARDPKRAAEYGDARCDSQARKGTKVIFERVTRAIETIPVQPMPASFAAECHSCRCAAGQCGA